MTNIFNEQKQRLLDTLASVSNKLLFPTSLINSLQVSGLSNISSFCKSYNYYLQKIRLLEIKLNYIQAWSLFYNSHYAWNVSVTYNIAELNIYINEIINITKNATDPITIFLMTQNNICSLKLAFYTNIQKKNNSYVYSNSNNNGTLSYEKIQSLLPRCITNKPLIINDRNIVALYEPIHELEPVDCLVPTINNESYRIIC